MVQKPILWGRVPQDMRMLLSFAFTYLLEVSPQTLQFYVEIGGAREKWNVISHYQGYFVLYSRVLQLIPEQMTSIRWENNQTLLESGWCSLLSCQKPQSTAQ